MKNISRFHSTNEQEAVALGLVLSVTVQQESGLNSCYRVSRDFKAKVKHFARQFGLGIRWVIDDSQRCLNFDDVIPIGAVVSAKCGDINGQIKGFLRKAGAEFGQTVVLYQPEETWAVMPIKDPTESSGCVVGHFPLESIDSLVSLIFSQSQMCGDMNCLQPGSVLIEAKGKFSLRHEPGLFERWRLSLLPRQDP